MVPLDTAGVGRFLRNFSSTTMGPNWRAAYPNDIVFQQSFEEFICETLACTAEETVSGIIRDMVMSMESYDRTPMDMNTRMAPIGTERKKKDEPEQMKTDKVNLELKPKREEDDKPAETAQPTVNPAKPPPKAQCPKSHRDPRQRVRCPLRHPRRNCEYYPKCRTTVT